MSFLSRLAALVPPPRMHLVTYHGVLAPSARKRERIVPVTLPGRNGRKQPVGDVPIVPAPKEGVMGTVAAVVRPRDGKLDSEESREREQEQEQEQREWGSLPVAAAVLVGGADEAGVPGGRADVPGLWRATSAAGVHPEAVGIERILSHLGLPTEPPKLHPARASPEQEELGFAE